MSSTYASLVAAGNAKIAQASGVDLAPAEPASPAHAAVLGAVDELLGLITANAANLPGPARMMLGVVQQARGQLTEGLQRMPEAQLLAVLRSVGERIVSVPGVLPQ